VSCSAVIPWVLGAAALGSWAAVLARSEKAGELLNAGFDEAIPQG
jgi:hypothetical protein